MSIRPSIDPSNSGIEDIHVPATIDGVAKMMTARGWEKSAIIGTYVRRQQGRRTSPENRGSCTIKGFADYGFVGMSDPETVSLYLRVWEYAIKQGWVQRLKPGDTIAVPDVDWRMAKRQALAEAEAAELAQAQPDQSATTPTNQSTETGQSPKEPSGNEPSNKASSGKSAKRGSQTPVPPSGLVPLFGYNIGQALRFGRAAYEQTRSPEFADHADELAAAHLGDFNTLAALVSDLSGALYPGQMDPLTPKAVDESVERHPAGKGAEPVDLDAVAS